MLMLVQLADGCYKLVIEVSGEGYSFHREYTFTPAESDAEPMVDGEKIVLRIVM